MSPINLSVLIHLGGSVEIGIVDASDYCSRQVPRTGESHPQLEGGWVPFSLGRGWGQCGRDCMCTQHGSVAPSYHSKLRAGAPEARSLCMCITCVSGSKDSLSSAILLQRGSVGRWGASTPGKPGQS